MRHSTPVSGSLGFIHIPKNAGTSVIQAIADNRLPIHVSSHVYPSKIADQEIVVLRCPFGRFVSAFRYGRKYWPSQVNEQFSSADELASSAADPDHPKHALAWIELGNRPEDLLMRDGEPTPQQTVGSKPTAFAWVYEPQSTWLVNQPRHILRYSHLAEDFTTLLDMASLGDSVVLPRMNQSEGRDERLSAEARAFLERIYAADIDFIRSRELDV
jgi:hypothetical protein